MQELLFTVAYERGANDLMDVFIEHPDLHARTLTCHATEDTMWRLDEVTGSSEAIADYDDQLRELNRCSNLVGMGGCEIDWTYEVLSAEPTSRLVYSRQSEGGGCRSIPYLAARHFGDGVLYQAEQRGNRYKWRLLVSDDATASTVYDEIRRNLRDGLTLTFDHISESEAWSGVQQTESKLPYEQRVAVELAAAHGYYETPRQASLQEIAEVENIPTSTLQYRLTRAEATLAKALVSSDVSNLMDAPSRASRVPL